MTEAAYLAVARFRKPHGLKGDAVIIPLTDEPDEVFVAGRALVPLDADGHPTGPPLVVRTARRYQRQWLLGFEGVTDRGELEQWPQTLLGARQEELTPPADGEMYYHEIPGATVVENGVTLGVATRVFGVPGGEVLAIEREGREHLIPFRAPIVERLDRTERRIEVKLPAGLLEI